MNKKGFIALINGDYKKRDIFFLERQNVNFYVCEKIGLSKILFYQLSTKISEFVVSEYGGGTCFPFAQKKKMLLVNFFPISP